MRWGPPIICAPEDMIFSPYTTLLKLLTHPFYILLVIHLWGRPSFCVVCLPRYVPWSRQTTKTDRLPHARRRDRLRASATFASLNFVTLAILTTFLLFAAVVCKLGAADLYPRAVGQTLPPDALAV